MDYSNLFVGVIFGFLLNEFAPKLIKKIWSVIKSLRIHRRQKFLESGQIENWILKYYDIKGNSHDLYDCKIGTFETKIPFMTKSEWETIKLITLENSTFLSFAQSQEPNFPINSSLLKSRMSFGQRLFNEPALYADRIETKDNNFIFHVKTCQYFQHATLLAGIEKETIEATKKNKFNKLPLREKGFPNAERAFQLPLKPCAIGCVCNLAFKKSSGIDLLIQTRSHETITGGGTKSGIPQFGLSPVVGNKIVDNLFIYNFIKEYCEELYNYDELIEMMSKKKPEPFWFYELPEARELLEAYNNGYFTLTFLGFGFDLHIGALTLCFLGVFENLEVSNKIRHKFEANWEVARGHFDNVAMEFVDIKSPKLQEWLKNGKLYYSSAYCISKTLDILSD